MRNREDRTENFIKDIRRNVENDNRKGGNRNDSSEWSNNKNSPRHKPRPLMSSSSRSSDIGDWSDQVSAEAGLQSPAVPTAMVSPRKIEEASDGMITVTKNNDRRQQQHPTSPPSKQPVPLIKPMRSDNNYAYGIEPPPFKDSSKSQMKSSDIGFSQHPSQYSKPFSSSSDQEYSPSSNWKCPDPGCKQVNMANRSNCVKCGISYKAATDYINNYACDKVKQEFATNSKVYPGKQEYSNGANGYAAASSNPAIPQPMLPGIKDWNVEVDQGSGWTGGPGVTMTTVSADNWVDQSNMMYAMAPHGHMDPMQYGMMVSTVPVPSYPPPYYNQTQPHYYNQSDYYPPDYTGQQGGYQPGQNNISVFNPSAQVYVPDQTAAAAHVYKAPPPFTQNKSYSSSPKPFTTFDASSSSSSNDPNLMLALNKPPNPLSLRRPQDSQPARPSKLQERLNQNRQSQERDKPHSRSSDNSHKSGSRFQHRLNRDNNNLQNNQKPPSMIEMQSGVLKKGSMILPPPGKGNGLLIFSSHSLDEAALTTQLNVPVKYVPCHKLETFQEKAVLLNPSRDWLVLLHGLGPDARAIADTKKTDVDKANDADNLANMFCDIIENKLLTSASHIYVLVSMLLPRIDLQEATGMNNPNNVRKVINVQITQRLYENSRVSLINSDKILEWGDDDVRLNELIRPDGFSLTNIGHNLVLDNWTSHIKKKMNDVNYVPSSNNKPAVNTKKISRDNTNLVSDNVKPVEKETEPEDNTEEQDDTVNDPFGSYNAPIELVSRPRTTSTSGPALEDTEDLDDDSLPNLETVNNKSTNDDLVADMKAVSIKESPVVNGAEDQFQSIEGGGFIEDNYCGPSDESNKNLPLPSMMSMGPSSDVHLSSGHFMEDSYLPPTSLDMETVEITFTRPAATSVKIAGDFNNWESKDMEKGSEANTWKFLVDLPPGKYQYKFVVDGDWVLDDTSDIVETSDGNKNNVIEVVKH